MLACVSVCLWGVCVWVEQLLVRRVLIKQIANEFRIFFRVML